MSFRRLLVLAPLTVGLLLPSGALAAPAPGVATRAAAKVGQAAATLQGRVDPNGTATTYTFEYGPTKAYGLASVVKSAGAGTKARNVGARVTGLAPATVYHYRVVATSTAGTRRSGDRTFKTDKQPLGLLLAATPNPVPFGENTVLSGFLAGTDNAGKQILLEQNPFPYTSGFTAVGNPQVTGSTGAFSFPILGLTATTQYRVRVPGRAVASPIVLAEVSVTVRTAVSKTRVKRGRSIRFAGSITPRQDGTQVAVQKLRDGRWITIGGTRAQKYKEDRSKYAVKVKVPRGGSYRIFVGSDRGELANNVGRTVKIRSFR